MTYCFQIIHQSYLHGLHAQSMGKWFMDSLIDKCIPLLLSKLGYRCIAEYLIRVRYVWFCYCCHDLVISEGYNPNRAAILYDLTQATHIYGFPLLFGIIDTCSLGMLSLSVRPEVESMVWAFLLCLGTDSCLYLAPWNANTIGSH